MRVQPQSEAAVHGETMERSVIDNTKKSRFEIQDDGELAGFAE
ncbi:hypothetical protein ACFVUY_24745 [Kitasatospora sp. NPDC058063]